ncbi:unnamed protein product [marine sediment metagenome]|uniref:Uncharacterized protein n=1 Tax=marine sediment metagenome TaxID=412755 RepID=X1QVK3_9ZZZZ
MARIKRKVEKIVFDRDQGIKDAERISNILNERIKRDRKNPFLNPGGGFDLIEKFPDYESKKKRKKKR